MAAVQLRGAPPGTGTALPSGLPGGSSPRFLTLKVFFTLGWTRSLHSPSVTAEVWIGAPGPNGTGPGLCASMTFFFGASVSQDTSEPCPSTAPDFKPVGVTWGLKST